MKDLQAIVRTLTDGGCRGAVLATLVRVEGSSYRRPGARLLVLPDGRRVGSISGGCLEEDVLERARRVASTGEPDTVVYDTTSENDLVWGVGLGCHGIVRVLIEPVDDHAAWFTVLAANFTARRTTLLAVTHRGANARLGTALAQPGPDGAPASSDDVFVDVIAPPTHLAIFGAGDDARPLVRLAKELGWVVTVADPRTAFATRERFPLADAILVAPAAELGERTRLDAQSVAVVMTHHYVHDLPIVRALLPAGIAYLGLLGPQKRAEKILADIAHGGVAVTAEQRSRLHAPVGLDLGADGAEQVALSIVAEIQAELAGRRGRPLRERTGPIHA